MKRSFILSALLFAVVLFSASSKDPKDYKYPFQEAKVSYHNVTVYKVLDHKDAYVVMYAKGHRDVGTVTVPKKWYDEKPAKVSFRPLPKGMTSYMTVISKEGSFNHLILTLPTSHSSKVWGVADSSVQISDANKDTFEIAY